MTEPIDLPQVFAEEMVLVNRALLLAGSFDGPEFDRLRSIEKWAEDAGVLHEALRLRRQVEAEADRMPRVLSELKAVWAKHPDWHLGQVVANAMSLSGLGSDPLTVTDAAMLSALCRLSWEPVLDKPVPPS